jgi:DsbC/DsbD-like thiol-disulfide interchange protein
LFLEAVFAHEGAMKTLLALVFTAIALTFPSAGALAASTEWIEEEGARIRLVAAEPGAGDAQIRAALQIELKEGWKTYWRDPGDAGVPPQISVTGEGISGFELHYPAPDRFDDGKSVWAGYKHMVAFPLTLQVTAGKPSYALDVKSFLGICQEICVPVQSQFSLEVPQAKASSEEQALVSLFFDALPAPATAEFGIAKMNRAGEGIEIEMNAPAESGPVELFLAADGYMFAPPRSVSEDGGIRRFAAKIIFAPKKADAQVFYTVKSAKGAISGTAALPAN